MGGGELWLTPSVNMVREPWTAEKLLKVISFFEAQPYLTQVKFGAAPEDAVNLDKWRTTYRRRVNLSDHCARHFNVQPWDWAKPWCVVDCYDDETHGKVVIHRSPRYHSRDFPWADVVDNTEGNAVFVGSPDEHEAFCCQFGHVPHYHTPTLLALARAIAGCRLFVGNQSTPRALAESLKRRVYVEEDRHSQNTNFRREGAWYGRKEFRQALMAYAASYRFE